MKTSVGNVITIKSGCRFCSYLKSKEGKQEIDDPWLKSGHYAAMTSIGGFVSGWSLVCPVEHSLNLSESYGSRAFWSFADQAISILSRRYGNVCVFEHGSQFNDSETSCGTAHAHLHIVPVDFSLEDESVEYGKKFNLEWLQCYAVDIVNISKNQEYLFVADNYSGIKTKGRIALLSQGVSQFFRQVIAHKLGVYEQYNYKSFPMIGLSTESAKLLRADVFNEQFVKVGNF